MRKPGKNPGHTFPDRRKSVVQPRKEAPPISGEKKDSRLPLLVLVLPQERFPIEIAARGRGAKSGDLLVAPVQKRPFPPGTVDLCRVDLAEPRKIQLAAMGVLRIRRIDFVGADFAAAVTLLTRMRMKRGKLLILILSEQAVPFQI